MNFFNKISELQKARSTLLCVGLDPEIGKFPGSMGQSPSSIFPFNRAIIDATADVVCCYKPNIAFYEQYGEEGRTALTQTMEYIRGKGVPTILDAKRADIGNTGVAYARAIFEVWGADATTVNPYFGKEGIEPFISYRDKGIFVLALTSHMWDLEGEMYLDIARKVAEWNTNKNFGLVVAANQPAKMKKVRAASPAVPFLIPGVGAQKGDISEAVQSGTAGGAIAIINASRSISYASAGKDFAEAAGNEAKRLSTEFARLLLKGVR